jgi:hypothetical protein
MAVTKACGLRPLQRTRRRAISCNRSSSRMTRRERVALAVTKACAFVGPMSLKCEP